MMHKISVPSAPIVLLVIAILLALMTSCATLKQNRASIEKILRTSDQWQGSLGTLDKVALGVRTVQKPYIRDLIDLGPKFKRKYKQYAFVLEMTSKITGGLTKFAGKELF